MTCYHFIENNDFTTILMRGPTKHEAVAQLRRAAAGKLDRDRGTSACSTAGDRSRDHRLFSGYVANAAGGSLGLAQIAAVGSTLAISA